jgi:hypothetical protein
MTLKTIALSSVAVTLFAVPAVAHHSFAMFDASRTSHVGGTVTNFEWINPHVWLHVNVVNDAGVEEEWSFEAGSVRQLQTSFWEADSVKPGDVLTDVAFHPLKDGSNGGQLLEVMKSDGTYLCQGPECRERQEQERAGGGDQSQAAPDPEAVPDFFGYWQRRGEYPSTWEIPDDPAQRPGPLVNTITDERRGLVWVADHTNPILQPWNAEYLRERGKQEVIEVQTVAHNICWPSGVPQVANMREPVQFLQEDDQVTLVYQRDHQVRYVHLNTKHPDQVEPSWYGHSIGHYEGDTLVIDTVGLRDWTGVDRFNTRHTDKLHVVERYRVIEDGKALRLNFVVEDPGAFTALWYGQATYGENRGPVQEVVCAENNRDITNGLDGEYPVPKDEGPYPF